MSKFLKKKGNTGGMDMNREILPNQGRQGPMPSAGVSNTAMQSTGNTKAPGVTQPQGKTHAKVMGAPKNLKHGKYL